MVFVLSVMAIFIVVSVYFYFKAESLQKDLIGAKRESSSIRKESKLLTDSIALIAKKNEEFAQFRFKKYKVGIDAENELIRYLTPLTKNYSAIVRESLKGKGATNAAIKKTIEAFDPSAAKQFGNYVAQKNHIKRMWSSNNLNGFMSLVEALLEELQQEEQAK